MDNYLLLVIRIDARNCLCLLSSCSSSSSSWKLSRSSVQNMVIFFFPLTPVSRIYDRHKSSSCLFFVVFPCFSKQLDLIWSKSLINVDGVCLFSWVVVAGLTFSFVSINTSPIPIAHIFYNYVSPSSVGVGVKFAFSMLSGISLIVIFSSFFLKTKLVTTFKTSWFVLSVEFSGMPVSTCILFYVIESDS